MKMIRVIQLLLAFMGLTLIVVIMIKDTSTKSLMYGLLLIAIANIIGYFCNIKEK